jgi:hypothetical protein
VEVTPFVNERSVDGVGRDVRGVKCADCQHPWFSRLEDATDAPKEGRPAPAA